MGNSWAVGYKKLLSSETELETALLDKSFSNKFQPFSFNDLKKATENFRPENFLGGGRDGHVFKGWIDENTYAHTKPGSGVAVAIKKLVRYIEDEEEWLEEVNFLGQLHHENLVKLIGYCLEGKNRFLVYEFMPKGSLAIQQFTRQEPIPWATRVKIAIGVARGIAFLHSIKEKVIFLDLKAHTILFDSDFNAKLFDFGLARYDPSGQAIIPECRISYWTDLWVARGYYTPTSDVYSFGLVLLGLLTGICAIEVDFSRKKLLDKTMPFLSERGMVSKIMDRRLGGQYSKEGAQAAAALAFQCLNKNPNSRPPIVQVLAALEGLHYLDT